MQPISATWRCCACSWSATAAKTRSLVAALVRAQSHGNAVWQEARRLNDFSLFAPALEQIIQLRLEQATQLKAAEPVERSPWEILAQPFEPDISKQRLEVLFDPLRQRLPALLARVPATDGAAAELPESLQEQLSIDLLESWGYDNQRCQRSRSAHPFSCTLGPQDYRITTRVVAGQPFSCFLATAHEWGHSLYEQGLPHDQPHAFPWPLGDATSMGVHESQSLFWECRVARSEAFAAAGIRASASAWAPILGAGLSVSGKRSTPCSPA